MSHAPGWGVRCGFVCLGSSFGCAPPFPAGMFGCVCVSVLRLYFATPGSDMRCACVCLISGFGCAPPLLARVLGSVFVCVRALLVPRHSWLGCGVRVCVLGLRFWLRPATPCPGAGVYVFLCALPLYHANPSWGARCGCVCLGSSFGCAPPLLAGVLWSMGVSVRTPLVPPHCWLGCAVWVCLLGLRSRLRPANSGLVVGVCVCLCARCACTPPLLF